MSALRKPFMTPEQYLEIERKAEFKSEYFAGTMYAMAGVSRVHSLITGNIGGELHARLKGRPCETFMSAMRIRVTETGLYTYPDVIVVSEESLLADAECDTLLNPTVIFEVLSPSTESYDRGEKFAHYRRLETLTDYIVVAQSKCHVEHYKRQPDGDWLLHEVDDPDGEIHLSSIDCRLPLSEIYDRVTFDPDLELRSVEIR